MATVATVVGSGGGAAPVGSGAWIPLAFAAVLSPAPIGPFPPPALRTGRADFPHPALQWDHASRTRNAGASHRGTDGVACLRLPEAARPHLRGVPRPRAAGPVHAPAVPGLRLGPAPSLTHVMLRNYPPLDAGFVGRATPAGLRSSVIPAHLRLLSSAGITPRLRYYEPLRHPAGPACPSRGPGCRVHGTGRASRVAAPSIFHACRRHYPGGNRPVRVSLTSRPVNGLPLITGGSASAVTVSRPARRSLAFRPAWSLSRPRRPVCQSASAHVVTSMNRPGCYQPERQLPGGIHTHQESAPFHGALSTIRYIWKPDITASPPASPPRSSSAAPPPPPRSPAPSEEPGRTGTPPEPSRSGRHA